MKNRASIPPRLAERVVSWLCKDIYREEIIGDLHEYYDEVRDKARWQRNLLYWFQTFNFLKPWSLKRISGGQLNNIAMLKNYFKISWRGLLRQKLYSSINIGGLTIGLTCFIVIFLYVQHELSYDRFYTESEDIYRIYKSTPGYEYLGTDKNAYMTVGAAPMLMADYPEVAYATTLRDQVGLLSYNEKHHHEEGLRADKNFFNVFGLDLIQGNKENALENAESLILTASLAKKMFGDTDPIGQPVLYHNRITLNVSGIIADPPTNSSLRYSFITSMLSSSQYTREMNGDRWNNFDYYTFLRLQPNANAASFESKLESIVDTYHPDFPFELHFHVQPIHDLYLETNVNSDLRAKGNPQYVKLFSFIAIVVILLASFNYMNLAIARSIRRAKEVGLRKVIGAVKRQLILQFITESVMISFIALFLAILCTYFVLPFFANWLERPITLDLLTNTWLIPGLIGLTFIVGVFSGSYPALFMSALKPVDVLKGKINKGLSGLRLQRLLVIAQYATSIVLVIGSLVIASQFRYIQDKELGYDKEQIVTITTLDRQIVTRIDELKNQWSVNPNIVSVTTTSELPTNVTSGTLARPKGSEKDKEIKIYRSRMDFGYLDVFGLELIAGRDFSPEIKSDLTTARIINESAAKAFGWTPEEAIGKQITEVTDKTIIGVIKDFHMHSMHLEIAPMMLMMKDNWFRYVAIKVRPENLSNTIASIEGSIKGFSPYPVEYRFLDDHFDELYRTELRLGDIFGVFTILAIMIASLGLFGIAAFSTGQRKKEIGIRKVLGASVKSITTSLASDFLKLVVFGFVIAIPIAWYTMDSWLNDFAYRVNLEWWMFLIAGGSAFIIAFFTISAQSVKAALSNPVNCLQHE